MDCRSGITCWHRLKNWQQACVRQRLYETLLAKLEATPLIDWSRASVDSISIPPRWQKDGLPVGEAVLDEVLVP